MSKKTPFYNFHIEQKAKMVDFGGWLMPVQYSHIKKEHLAVRSQVGLFDASHMGEFLITGQQALDFVDYLVTNSIADKKDGKTIYSPLCNEQGGFIDDLLVYKFNSSKIRLVVNASNIEKDWNWINKQAQSYDVTLENQSSDTALLALQGPKSADLLSNLVEKAEILKSLEYYSFYEDKLSNIPLLISRTGYTGELGFELYFHKKYSQTILNELMALADSYNLTLCGLGARDSLRLEKGYLLYGNDMNETITPIEADVAWTVKWDKDFIGKKVLQNLTFSKKLIGFEMLDNRIPRHGYKIFSKGDLIGEVTSGGISFSLEKNIGMGYVQRPYAELETPIQIEIRDKKFSAKVVKKTFVR